MFFYFCKWEGMSWEEKIKEERIEKKTKMSGT